MCIIYTTRHVYTVSFLSTVLHYVEMLLMIIHTMMMSECFVHAQLDVMLRHMYDVLTSRRDSN
jgi:hypothetical protein